MTEAEWLAATDPRPMLEYLDHRGSDRKFRLFAVSCCRRIARDVVDGFLDDVLHTAEQFADEIAGIKDLQRVQAKAWPSEMPGSIMAVPTSSIAREKAYKLAVGICVIATERGDAWIAFATADRAVRAASMPSWETERACQAALLRHGFGNPFRPYLVRDPWPAAVSMLADALYQGEACSFALHDALLESGYPDLAEHFQEPEHPKGCWVLDLILGKS